jgi:hypothetical protein
VLMLIPFDWQDILHEVFVDFGDAGS